MTVAMITEDHIRALEREHQWAPPVVSFYVNTDRGDTEGRSMLASLWHLLKTADVSLARCLTPERAAARERLHADVTPRVLAFLEREVEPVPAIRSMAAFASLGAPLADKPAELLAYTLPRPVRSQVHVAATPYIRPLLFLLDQYERYAVLITDRTHARFFTVFLGEIEENVEFTSDTPTHHHERGWSRKRFQRHLDTHILTHVQRATGLAVHLLRTLPTHRLILGGDGEIIHRIRHELPEDLRPRIVGTFPVDARASVHELCKRTLVIARQAEEREERAAVQRLRDALAHRGHAVQGLPATLDALTARRALLLAVARGYRAPGALCPNCSALLLSPKPCPHCRAASTPVEDIVEHAIERAYHNDVTIEFVSDSLDLDAIGHIGAILRF